ncbi:hypothetical protein Tco_0927867, partial [Tanacetum coccineum]
MLNCMTNMEEASLLMDTVLNSTIEEIHLMCEEERMKAIPFMAPFPANYCETMPWASEKPYIYSVVENTCNEANLSDLDGTGKGIILAGNDALGSSSTTAHAWIPGFSLISLFQFLPFCLIKGNAKCTDNAKIARNRSKPDKHGHGKGKRIQEPGECYQ